LAYKIFSSTADYEYFKVYQQNASDIFESVSENRQTGTNEFVDIQSMYADSAGLTSKTDFKKSIKLPVDIRSM